MLTEFELSPLEEKRAKEFKNKHLECARKCPSTIGGHIDYIFTPNSLYRGLVMKCNICREEKNITDYNGW